MTAHIIKNHYSSNGGTNNSIVYNVVVGFSLIESFRGKNAEQKASKYVINYNQNIAI